MKDYYFSLMDPSSSKGSYVTEPHLSMASGTGCVTISSFFMNEEKKRFILCLDVNTHALGDENSG